MIWLRLAPYIALLLATGVIYFLWKDGQHLAADKARIEADLSTAKAANEESQKAITNLQEQNRRDNVVLAQVQSELTAINDTMQENAQAIYDLEKSNEGVRAYLGTAVPPDLRMRLEQ